MALLQLVQAIGSHVTADNLEQMIDLVEKLIALAETMESSTNSNKTQNGSASGS
jgi:hypothetical protein